VTSRYPLWDLKQPQLTSDVPHTHQGDRAVTIDVTGKDAGTPHVPMAAQSHRPSESAPHIETETYSARKLGIALPDPTIKPLITAIGLTIMLTGLLFMHHAQTMDIAGKAAEAKTSMTMFWVFALGGAALMVGMLYNWMLTPLESHHPHATEL
jgi:hypothetical protein